MAKKRGNKKNTIRISKLTNLFFGIALGFGLGYRGGSINLFISIIFIIITILLVILYGTEK